MNEAATPADREEIFTNPDEHAELKDEVERLTRLLDLVKRMSDVELAKRRARDATIARVRELHSVASDDVRGRQANVCAHDLWMWPCPTIKALELP
jgi:hypothetical protein